MRSSCGLTHLSMLCLPQMASSKPQKSGGGAGGAAASDDIGSGFPLRLDLLGRLPGVFEKDSRRFDSSSGAASSFPKAERRFPSRGEAAADVIDRSADEGVEDSDADRVRLGVCVGSTAI